MDRDQWQQHVVANSDHWGPGVYFQGNTMRGVPGPQPPSCKRRWRRLATLLLLGTVALLAGCRQDPKDACADHGGIRQVVSGGSWAPDSVLCRDGNYYSVKDDN